MPLFRRKDAGQKTNSNPELLILYKCAAKIEGETKTIIFSKNNTNKYISLKMVDTNTGDV